MRDSSPRAKNKIAKDAKIRFAKQKYSSCCGKNQNQQKLQKYVLKQKYVKNGFLALWCFVVYPLQLTKSQKVLQTTDE